MASVIALIAMFGAVRVEYLRYTDTVADPEGGTTRSAWRGTARVIAPRADRASFCGEHGGV